MNQLDIRWRVKGLDDNRPCVPHCLQTVSSLRPCSSLKLGHGTWSTGTAAKIHWEKKFLLSSSNTWLSNLFHVWYDLLMLLLLFFLIWRCVENLTMSETCCAPVQLLACVFVCRHKDKNLFHRLSLAQNKPSQAFFPGHISSMCSFSPPITENCRALQ